MPKKRRAHQQILARNHSRFCLIMERDNTVECQNEKAGHGWLLLPQNADGGGVGRLPHFHAPFRPLSTRIRSLFCFLDYPLEKIVDMVGGPARTLPSTTDEQSMRILGPNTWVRRHEQDLLCAGAACKADKQSEVKQVGDEFLERHKQLKTVRGGVEDAEDGLVIADAVVGRSDAARDASLVSLGVFVDALGGDDGTRLFRMSASVIVKLGYQRKTYEIEAILTRIRQYPEDHPMRVEYEQRLADENQALRDAGAGKDEAEQKLVAALCPAASRAAPDAAAMWSSRPRPRECFRRAVIPGRRPRGCFRRAVIPSHRHPAAATPLPFRVRITAAI